MVRNLLAACGVVASLALGVAGLWRTEAVAQDAAPAGAAGTTTLALVEHNDHTSTIDVGQKGNGPGDMLVWGPNPLFDEATQAETGATTQGTCIAIDADFTCMVSETIVFPDGSTLEFQGVELGAAPSLRTIVGGSGSYLGAVGTARISPSADSALWTRVIDVTVPQN